MSDKKKNEGKSYGLIKVKDKGQITLLKKIREKLGIKVKDCLMLNVDEDKIILSRVKILVDGKEVVFSGGKD